MAMRCPSPTKAFVEWIEVRFYRLGAFVCERPRLTAGVSLAAVALAGLWLVAFGLRKESDSFRLWVPPESRFASDTEWLAERFGAVVRPQRVIAVGSSGDVLRPEALAGLARLHRRVVSATPVPYDDVCLRVPAMAIPKASDRRRRSGDFFDDIEFDDAEPETSPVDPSVSLDPRTYCGLLDALPKRCLSASPLEAWNSDPAVIANLTKDEIVEGVRRFAVAAAESGLSLGPDAAFGGVTHDSDGRIASADSVMLTWFVKATLGDPAGNSAGTSAWSSAEALAWESQFLDAVRDTPADETPGVDLFYESGRSFGDSSGDVMFRDVDKLTVGMALMFVYIQAVLSKFNRVELRVWLGMAGLACVGMALLVACAVCSALGAPYGPVHNSLPFLLMGLGIDDMFVMKACWETLTERERLLPLPQRVGLMLRHAGVSIVVTSFTDVVAFLVGSVTVLPSLQSFCLYAAAGVFFIFAFSVTFYVAAFAADAARVEEKRDGLLVCVTRPDCRLSDPDVKSISHAVIRKLYADYILKTPSKIVIVFLALVSAGYSSVAIFDLEQRFDPDWFIPENTYYSHFLSVRKEYYPDMGSEGSVFLGGLNYTRELPKIFEMVERLQNETRIVHDIDTWTEPFARFVADNYGKDARTDDLSDVEFSTYLSKFLFSPVGGRHQVKFRFSEPLACGKPAPPITVSSVDFRFRLFSGPKVYLPAKHRIADLVDGMNFTTGDGFATVWAKVFGNWETDEVIHVEVERNLELALVCVTVCTFVLIADFQMCLWIFACVLLTLVNVCGWMQRWGLTIDIVTCIGLELGVGFCVDYAAHVGHTFLTVRGTRQERALSTVTSIGAAVLYGGGSTLLSLSMLSVSETYVFKTFFKIFLLVIVFGLFHGLVLLPVALSAVGPAPYKNYETSKLTDGPVAKPPETVDLNDTKSNNAHDTDL